MYVVVHHFSSTKTNERLQMEEVREYRWPDSGGYLYNVIS